MINQLILIAYALLAISFFAVYLAPVRIGARVAMAPWAVLFAVSIACGLLSGLLAPLAVVALVVFCGVAYFARQSQPSRPATVWRAGWRVIAGLLTALLALALAMHKLPGFHNPIVISSLKLSDAAAPFTQYANYDKGAVGLVLLAFICRHMRSPLEVRSVLRQTTAVALLTTAAVIGASLAAGFIKPDFKLSLVTAQFLAINLFLTVIAEEAFFRGFLQERLATSLQRWRHGAVLAMVVCALLFGAAHAGGGVTYVLLATLAGLGYGYAYLRTQRIEAPVMVHLLLNAVHFIGFTYPYLA